MKKNFRILSILLVIALMLSALVIPTSAAIPPQKYGDVNYSGNIDVMDATNVQRYVAKVDLRAINPIEAADVDGDAKITVFDATIIQQYIAQIITEFPAGKEFYVDKYFYGVTADYDKNSAMVGYPVTFTAYGFMEPDPTTAKLYINDELVAETKDSREDNHMLYDLTYTFEKAGAYRVKVTLCDKWGNTNATNLWPNDGWTALYLVKDAPQDTTTPIITSITRDSNYILEPTFTVYAKFGTEPYQYKYTLYSFGEETYSTEYTDSNTFTVPYALRPGQYIDEENNAPYKIKVELKDAAGKTTTDELGFEIEPIKVG